MEKHLKYRTAIYFILIIVLVIGGSIISTRIWGEKPEQLPKLKELVINKQMTIIQFGQANGLSNAALKEIFEFKAQSDLERKLDEYGTADHISFMVTKKMALVSEHASKNWTKILIKFGIWIVFLSAIFILLRKRKNVSRFRNLLLFLSFLIFGIALGSDPSPMGTVKDAIHLYAGTHAIFPPRMIALSIFLAIVFFANKYICAWGCQAGTLQDLFFRINRTDKRKAIIGRQIKLPFALTNSVRFIFLGIFTLVAFLWGTDIIDPIDPFKIYKPIHLGFFGGVFIGAILLTSLFIYRPWCHLFCPFGLVGWLIEKVSYVKISVNYDTCIACQKCAVACPSTVMGAILKGNKITIPDCFACYTCREVCPTDSISFSSKKRKLPPSDFFERRQKSKIIA
jgi:NAD-dependent dihydropyrimidine dehydrogenase PreA subunit